VARERLWALPYRLPVGWLERLWARLWLGFWFRLGLGPRMVLELGLGLGRLGLGMAILGRVLGARLDIRLEPLVVRSLLVFPVADVQLLSALLPVR
jgi:hypothetical protein